MKILIQFPVRNRFAKFCSTIDQYIQKASSENELIYNISIDDDDTEITEQKIKEYLKKYPKVNYIISVNKNTSKVQAINRVPENIVFDVLLLASDDMIPKVMRYDLYISKYMQMKYPHTDGVLWFFDGYQKRLNTLCILGKKYYDRFGYIYNPNYTSLWCDNEFMDVANILKKQTYIDTCIIKHEHWANNKQLKKDPLYIKNDESADLDKSIYLHRKAHNFDI